MFTCYLGKGDKETFAYAFMAVGEPYTLVETPPRAIGTTGRDQARRDCALLLSCELHKLQHGSLGPGAETVAAVTVPAAAKQPQPCAMCCFQNKIDSLQGR